MVTAIKNGSRVQAVEKLFTTESGLWIDRHGLRRMLPLVVIQTN
jgi:hypothetical protein